MTRIFKKEFVFFVCLFCVSLLLAPAVYALEYHIGDKTLYIMGYGEQYVRFGMSGTTHSNDESYITSASRKGLMDGMFSLYTWQHLKWSDSLEFRTSFRYEGDWLSYAVNSGDHNDFDPIRPSRHNMRSDDHTKQIIRECNVAYFSRHLNVKIGKQTVAWGQTDLFRLMDMINPIDYRRMYVLRDSDYGYAESRVPLWIAKVEVFPEISIGDITGIALQFMATLDTESKTQFNIGPRNGGVWAFPIPADMPTVPLPGFGTGHLKDITIHDRRRSQSIDNTTFAFRMAANWGNTFFTINFYHGWDDMPVLVRDSNFLHAQNGGNVADGLGYGLNLQQIYHRKTCLGFTVSREMDFIRPFAQALHQPANPTLRVEAYYRWNKPVATDWIERIKNYDFGGATAKEYRRRDILRYMVGWDWPMRIHFLNPHKEFFTTFQFIHAHRMNGGDFWNAPYHSKDPKDKFDVTGLVNTTYFHDIVRPQIAFTTDLNHNQASLLKGSCRFWFGDHWRPEIGFMMITGKKDSSHGMFRDRDNIWLKVKYQF